MPQRLPTPCSHPGCPRLSNERFCEEHAKEHARADQQKYDKQRGSSSDRGYGGRWQRARRRYLSEHPLCVECEKHGRLTAATVVDHITPHKGDQQLFWDESNWQSLCKADHDKKTLEEGRWG